MKVIMTQIKQNQNSFRVVTFKDKSVSSTNKHFEDSKELLEFIKSFNLNYKLGTCNNGKLSMIVVG